MRDREARVHVTTLLTTFTFHGVLSSPPGDDLEKGIVGAQVSFRYAEWRVYRSISKTEVYGCSGSVCGTRVYHYLYQEPTTSPLHGLYSFAYSMSGIMP